MDNKIFGYIRVSTREQNVDRQVDELKKYVPNIEDMYIDRASGKDFDRPEYKNLKRAIRQGDTLYVKSLDRLGRNKEQIKEELQFFKYKGILVRILDVPTTLMDFSQFGEMQKAIFDMVNNILIEVLGTIAEQERKTIRQRQKEGIEAAKRRGKYLGRPIIAIPKNFSDVYYEYKSNKITAKTAIELLHLKRTTFYKLLKQFEEEKGIS